MPDCSPTTKCSLNTKLLPSQPECPLQAKLIIPGMCFSPDFLSVLFKSRALNVPTDVRNTCHGVRHFWFVRFGIMGLECANERQKHMSRSSSFVACSFQVVSPECANERQKHMSLSSSFVVCYFETMGPECYNDRQEHRSRSSSSFVWFFKGDGP